MGLFANRVGGQARCQDLSPHRSQDLVEIMVENAHVREPSGGGGAIPPPTRKTGTNGRHIVHSWGEARLGVQSYERHNLAIPNYGRHTVAAVAMAPIETEATGVLVICEMAVTVPQRPTSGSRIASPAEHEMR